MAQQDGNQTPCTLVQLPKQGILMSLQKDWLACWLTSEHLIWVIFELLEALLLVSSQGYDCLAPHAQLPLRNCMCNHLEANWPSRPLSHRDAHTSVFAVYCRCMSQPRHIACITQTTASALRKKHVMGPCQDEALEVFMKGQAACTSLQHEHSLQMSADIAG